MIAVITGATGLVGSLLLSKLLSDNAITKVIAITRKPLTLNHPKLNQFLVNDFSQLLDYKNDLKGDIYFCALGTTIKIAGTKENFRKVDFNAVVNFGKVAEYHLAQSFTVVSANMADAHSRIFYNKVKGETEQALMAMKFNRLIILRPSLLIGKRNHTRAGEEIFMGLIKVLSPILTNNLKKKFATQIETLTDRMLKEGKNPASKIKIINAIDI